MENVTRWRIPDLRMADVQIRKYADVQMLQPKVNEDGLDNGEAVLNCQ
jgi:hypothetical protein